MKWIRLAADYWYLPAVLAVVVIAYVTGAGKWAAKLLKSELSVVEAKRAGRDLAIRHGANEAVARIEIDHAETIAELDAKETKKVDRLRRDPPGLSRELTRIGQRRRAARAARGN